MTIKQQPNNVSFHLVINPEDDRTFGPCNCCGKMTRRVWGYVTQDEGTIAAYFVEWTPGHEEQAANFDLIVGKWGPEAGPADRKAVALDFRQLETGPAFRVINAADRPVGKNSLVGEALSREQVIGESVAQTVFAICDTVFLDDPRVLPLRERNSYSN
jgi:hypothetical protein